jgi:hypothetical protein
VKMLLLLLLLVVEEIVEAMGRIVFHVINVWISQVELVLTQRTNTTRVSCVRAFLIKSD